MGLESSQTKVIVDVLLISYFGNFNNIVWTEAASQNASQGCTFGATLVLLWFTVSFI